jgi:hypothetical protein
MRYLAILGAVVLFNVIWVHGSPVEECKSHDGNGTHKVADTKFCDKYYECTKAGKANEQDCRDGYVFSEITQQCDFPFKVPCGSRTERQPSQSQNPLCERLYGLYPFDPKESCAKFYHCQEGVAYEQECPDTSIYDPTIGTCVHPGAANRKDCSASQVFNYQCPNFGKKFAKLRFYDHDRLKHPEDCRKYLACFTDGQPRLLSCPYKTVFNEAKGRCIKYEKHPDPECKSYYNKGGKGYREDTEDDESSGDEIDSSEIHESNDHKGQQNKQSLKKNNPKSKRQSGTIDLASLKANPAASRNSSNDISKSKKGEKQRRAAVPIGELKDSEEED